jgi:anaerobic magnesium-protoporphyrin IX monomethyl ester cyclase
MRVALIETRGEKLAVNKDQAGTFGTALDAGEGLFTKILNRVKRESVRVPVVYMAYMYSIFKKENHEVHFYDKLPENNPELVIIATSTVDYKNEIKMAKEIKRKTDAKVGFIGAFATTNPDLFLQEGDFVISGEPEEATFRIAKGETEPKGVIFSELITDLDILPLPNWGEHPINEYRYYPLLKKTPFLPILSSRGCPFDCSYCPYMVLETPQWRKHSPKRVVDEIERNIKEYGMKSFVFRDPVFTLEKSRTIEICNLLIERKIDVEWVCETRIDTVDEELIDLMKKAGLKAINIGVEAFDLNLLKKMNRKPPSHEQQERVVNYAEKKGVKIMSFYVLGIPGQTKEDVEKSIEYSKYLNTSFAQFTIAQPYPGTKFYDDVKDKVEINEEWQKMTGYQPLIKLEHFTTKEILHIKERAFREYYLRLNWILKRGKGLFV